MEPTHSGKTLVPALAVLDNSDYATEDKMYLLLHWQDDLQELRSLRQVKSPSRLVRAGMRAGTTMKISESPSEALSLLSLSLSLRPWEASLSLSLSSFNLPYFLPPSLSPSILTSPLTLTLSLSLTHPRFSHSLQPLHLFF